MFTRARKGMGRLLRLGLLLGTIAGGATAASAQTTVDVRVPSLGGGMGGEIAVRAFVPAIGGERYGAACGVLVFFHGGADPGGLDQGAAERAAVREGLIVVKFIHPGGTWTDPATGVAISSTGIYDFRGPNCQLAARDVIRFCLGLQPDNTGNLITATLPALTTNVGLLGSSNGGNTALCTLARYGPALAGVGYFAGWENPASDQMAVGDLGAGPLDTDPAVDGDGNGIPTDDGTNPHFTGYGATTCNFAFGRIAYDPAGTTYVQATPYPGFAWFDGNANGLVDRLFLGLSASGEPIYSYDMNANGVLDAAEDYPCGGYEARIGGMMRLVHSAPVRSALAAFPVAATTATIPQTLAFWNIRQQVRALPSVAAALPNLLSISIFGQRDHSQAAHFWNGHLHVQQLLDGLNASGLWFRPNPDAAYLASIYARSGLPLPMGAPDNAANVLPAVGTLHGLAEPATYVSGWAQAAAAVELADRVFTGNLAPNLPGLLIIPPP